MQLEYHRVPQTLSLFLDITSSVLDILLDVTLVSRVGVIYVGLIVGVFVAGRRLGCVVYLFTFDLVEPPLACICVLGSFEKSTRHIDNARVWCRLRGAVVGILLGPRDFKENVAVSAPFIQGSRVPSNILLSQATRFPINRIKQLASILINNNKQAFHTVVN